MKRLNPIYMLALIATLFIISFTSLNSKQEQYEKSIIDLNSLSVKAKNFNDYKQTWFDEKNITKKIDSILKSSSFKNEKVLRTKNKNIIRVKIESDNPRVLNKFLNRILNEKFRFKKLDIKKRSIYLEVGIK